MMALELEFMRTSQAAMVSIVGLAAVLGGVLASPRLRTVAGGLPVAHRSHRRPLQIGFAVSVLIVLLVAVAHRLNISEGAILVGPDLAVVWQAMMAIGLLWLPVLVCEATAI